MGCLAGTAPHWPPKRNTSGGSSDLSQRALGGSVEGGSSAFVSKPEKKRGRWGYLTTPLHPLQAHNLLWIQDARPPWAPRKGHLHRTFCAVLGSRRTSSGQEQQGLFPGHEAGLGGPSEPLKGYLGEGSGGLLLHGCQVSVWEMNVFISSVFGH